MGIFNKKSDEEKMQKKQQKDARNRKRKAIAERVGRSERLTYEVGLNLAADEIRLDEEVEFVATGVTGDDNANSALVATNERIVIGWMKGLSLGHTEIRYSDIDQIDIGTKLTGSWVTLRHGSHDTTLSRSASRDLENLKKVVRDHQAAGQSAPTSNIDNDDLVRLAELHAKGVITDEEFAAAKAKALGI